jgi:hypothetical protein
LSDVESSISNWVFVVIMSVCVASVGLASAWTFMGSSQNLPRCLAVLFLAAFMGFIPGIFDRSYLILGWSFILVFQVLFVFVSLSIVRGCGFRLVPLSATP